jgi:hypothetical protein
MTILKYIFLKNDNNDITISDRTIINDKLVR